MEKVSFGAAGRIPYDFHPADIFIAKAGGSTKSVLTLDEADDEA